MENNDHDLALSPPWSLGQRAGTAILILLLPALLVLEWTAGTAFSLHVFYLVPLALAAWNFGYRAGGALAAASGGYCAFVAFTLRAPGTPLTSLVAQSALTLAMFVLFALVIAHHRRFVDRVVAAARLDVTSGALAPGEVERLLEREARRARRYARPLSLVILDIETTDEALVPRLVDALGRNLRECDLVGRLTQRRFVLVLVECPAREATRVMVRCREMLKQGFPGQLRCDVGAVSYGGSSPTNAQQLLHLAESHLTGALSGAMPETAQAMLA